MSTTSQALGISENRRGWIVWSSVITGLLVVLYAPIVEALAAQWWSDPDYGHGFFVPLFSAYLVWRQRSRLSSAAMRPSNAGLLVMMAAIVLLLLGSLGAELFTSRLSLLILIAGIVLFLAGPNVLRALAFPLGFLIFMIPLPAILYNEVTFPLQLLTSRLASAWLELIHVPVLRDGNVLVMSNYSLEVVEACSGIRSLMTLVSLAVAYGYLAEPRTWARWVLALLMVPGAIATNAVRVALAGMTAHRFGPAVAEGFLHEFSGWVVFLGAVILLFLFHWFLRRVRNAQLGMVRA